MIARLAIAVLLLAAGSAAAQEPTAPTGLWISQTDFGDFVRGEISVSVRGSRGEARIGGHVARFMLEGDSIAFRLPDDAGSFRGAVEPDRRGIRGFWIRPGKLAEPGYAASAEGGPFDQAYALPVRWARVANGRYRGVVTPLEARFTLYLHVWSDTSGLRAAFRNPEFNLQGGAPRFRLRVDGDSLRFVATLQPPDPDVRLTAAWDRKRSRITMPWRGLQGPAQFRPCGAESVGYWPRVPRGRAQQYRAPIADDDGWQTARATDVGMDETMLGELTQFLADTNPVANRAPMIHSCLIERHGKLVYEEYFFGFDRDRPHDLRSASKTFASVLLGAAMREGRPIAPESTLVSYRPSRDSDPRKNRITIGDLLKHTSGLSCDDGDEASPGSEDKMQGSGNWWQFTLDLPMAHEPGAHYAYCSGGLNLVGAALTAVHGQWLPESFDAAIARPLGFRRYHANLMPNGEGYLGGGMHLRPRDLLKLGRTYLDGGSWQGHPLVDSSWVRRSTSPQVAGPYGADGYAWHLYTLALGDRKYREYEASGNGGQFLIVLPELDISIVITAGNYMAGGIWTRFRSELVPQRILAAISSR